MILDCMIASLRNLGRKRFRSALTISGIAIGVASVVLIGSIGEIGKEAISQELNSLGMDSITISADRKFTNLKMNEDDLAMVREISSVKSAAPIVVDYSNIKMRGLVANSVLWGMDVGDSQLISLSPKYGRMLTESDLASAADVCVLDSNVAKLFYKRENIVGKQLNAMIGGSYVSLEIVGIVASGGSFVQNMMGDMIPSFVYLPYTTLQRYKGEREFEQIAISLDQKSDPESAAQQISSAVNRMHNLTRGFKADDLSKQKETLNRMLGIITLVLSAIAAISLVVAGLGIMTIMIVSVNERTREIGIKKSIGATQKTILVEFLIESFTISLIGSLVGSVIGMSFVEISCKLMGLSGGFHLQLIGISVGLSILVGVAFGVYPATIAAKLRPVDALRTE